MNGNYICALDIGSSKIAAVVALLEKRQIKDLIFATAPSRGVSKGSIVDSIELVETLGSLMKNLKRQSGIAIKNVHTNICGQDIITKHSRAIIPLAERGNKVITSADIERVNEQAMILGSHIEEEIIHQVPFSYSVDLKSGIDNPIGLYGHKLEIDAYLICARLSFVQTLTHAMSQAGYDIKEIFLSGLATSEVIFGNEYKAGTNVVCDMGSDITELLFFKDGVLRSCTILPIGGNDFTSVLANSLNIPVSLAEEIKLSYGAVTDFDQIPEDKEVLIKDEGTYKPIKQRLVAEIINSKAKAVSDTLKSTVEKTVALSEIRNFLVTGRAMLQEGLLEMIEKTFGIAVDFGRVTDYQLNPFVSSKDELSGRRYLHYLTSLGLICKELYGYHPKTLTIAPPKMTNPVLRVIDRARELYQEYF